MSVNEAVTQFAGVMDTLRNKLADVSAQIDSAKQERQVVVTAKPHTSDIVAAFQRGLKAQEQLFETQMRSFLASNFVSADDAPQAAQARAQDILKLPITKPGEPQVDMRHQNGRNPNAPIELNPSVIAYMLRDRLAEELPAIVDKLCPEAREGLKSAERNRQLAELDERLKQLQLEYDGVSADLAEARKAVLGA